MQIALAIPICIVYNIRAGLGLGSAHADVAQVVAHILGKDEVTSSSLVISSKNPFGKRLSSFHNWMAVFYFLWKELCLHIYTYLKLLSLTTAGNRLPFSAKSQSIFCKVVL